MERAMLSKAATLVALITSLVGPAHAADPPQTAYPVFAASPAFSWTGFYVGYNVGAGWNTQKTSSNFGSPWSTINIGFIGGGQAGYNYQIGSFVIGAEADADWMSESKSTSASGPTPAGLSRTTGQWNWTSSVGLRFGFAANCTLFYAKFGYGWATQTLAINSPLALGITSTFVSSTNGGELIGAGVEYAFPSSSWTAKLEYDYIVMASRSFVVSLPNTVTVTPNMQMLKVGFNYKM